MPLLIAIFCQSLLLFFGFLLLRRGLLTLLFGTFDLDIIEVVIIIVVGEVILVLLVVGLVDDVFLGHVNEPVTVFLLHKLLVRRGLHEAHFIVEVLLLEEGSGGVFSPVGVFEDLFHHEVLVGLVVVLLLLREYLALEPLGAEHGQVDIGSRDSHADQVDQLVLGLSVHSDLHVEDEVADREHQQRTLESLESETSQEEVKVQRARKPSEEIILVQPVLGNEDESEDAHPSWNHHGIKRNQQHLDKIKSVLFCEGKFRVLNLLIQFHLERLLRIIFLLTRSKSFRN